MKAIVDCNSFYSSCERVFRPDLESRPVAVLSNNDGCVIAMTHEVKALGVKMGTAFFECRALLKQHNVAVFSSNYNLYGDMSRRVMETVKYVLGADKVEVYSVDEAFLDVADIPTARLNDFARYLRETVEQWTGVSVSVGIAPTKVLSKMANRIAKQRKLPSKVLVLTEAEALKEAMQGTFVKDLWGIGSRYARKLVDEWNIHTAWELKHMSREWARANLGGVVGQRLIDELNGTEAITMDQPLVNKKMIATTRMFGHNVKSLLDIREAVATYTSRAAEKLRRQHSAAASISVFVVEREAPGAETFKRSPSVSAQLVLDSPTSATNELIKVAVQLAEQLFVPGASYKKAGVILSGLVPDSAIQSNLFGNSNPRTAPLMEMIDNINFSMRDDILRYATAGTTRNWKMQRNFHSPRYTTRWDEMPEVR